ncbi:MAG: hypothetical protein H6581_26765 [Bacteroidia bacterium]|nr:hypothetical protein [Bacteroidia bacterium]
MKAGFFTLTALALLLAAGCKSSEKPQKTEEGRVTVSEELTFTGTFQSKRGVMHPLSCFCGNGGILTTEGGKQISACFGEKEEVERCKTMRVKGVWVNKAIDPGESSPCREGEMEILEVKDYTCL